MDSDTERAAKVAAASAKLAKFRKKKGKKKKKKKSEAKKNSDKKVSSPLNLSLTLYTVPFSSLSFIFKY